MKSNLQRSSENQLITHLLQQNPQKSEFDSLLQQKIDWDYLFETSARHCTLPLLYKQFKSGYSDSIPLQILDKFQNGYQETAKFNFARATQLIKLVTQLQKHNLPIISYKGMALAEFAYKDITLRQFTDIDLLIRKKDFFKVKELLEQIGCKPAWDLTDKQEKAVLKHYYEYPFFYGENNTLIEVHWGFIESFFTFDFDMNSLWDRTIDVSLYGRQIPTLSAEDYLIVLSSHGSKHLWQRLSWICDIDRLVTNTDIDWDLVLKRATETASLRMVWLGLDISHQLLSTKIPSHINKDILSDETVKLLSKRFIENLFENDENPYEWKEMAKTHLKMRENFGTKLKYSKRLFTTKLIDKLFMPMGRPR